VFARPDGQPIHPGYVTQRFARLVKTADVPPIRLYDLRHGAASLAHEAGADLKTLQDLLGHASIVITADTYTSVLPLAQRRCAEATARLVLAAARRSRQKIKTNGRRNRPSTPRKTGAPTPTGPVAAKEPQVTGAPPKPATRKVTTPTGRHRGTHRPHRNR
jgi:Phage integrase family